MPGGGMPGMSGTGACWALNGHAATEGMDGQRRRSSRSSAVARSAIAIDEPHRMVASDPPARPLVLRAWRATAVRSRAATCSTRRCCAAGVGEIAFVADNPGDWMLHCHVLEHQATGMMATFRVA